MLTGRPSKFLIIFGLSVISLSVFAAPPAVNHKHGERSHSHVLPGGQANHQHNKGKAKPPAAKSPKQVAVTPAPKKKTKQPSMSLQTMQRVLRSLMKDPESVRFGKWWVGVGLPGKNEPQWCGFVNGKNSYGAYTGNKLFISTVDVDKQFSYWMKGPCKPLK